MLVDGYFARQPILDAAGRLRAYEVLFRPGPSERRVGRGAATAEVLASAFVNADGRDLLAGVPGFVNVPRPMLVDGSIRAFPAERVGVEVLEEVEPDRQVIDALVDLRAHGYQLALDDYGVGDIRRTLVGYVDIVKVDVMAVGLDRLAGVVAPLRALGATLLAEKVETLEEVDRCRALGFQLFQGYYFARPQLVTGRRLDEGRRRLLQLLAELHRPDISLDEVARAVEQHPNLAIQLLRLLNSAGLGIRRFIESIREAVIMLGPRRVTEFATVLVLAAQDHKPRELLALGLTRARMCEEMAIAMGRPDAASFFTVGVLSVVDALTDRPMPEAVADLPLADDVADALVEHAGVKGTVLDVAIGYERADWDDLPELAIAGREVAAAYLRALDWTTGMLAAV